MSTSPLPHFLKDLEVRDIDTLDLASLAHSLHQGVHLASLPFRIVLFGPWGSGKTTIMRRVQTVLDAATEAEVTPRFGPPQHEQGDSGDGLSPFVRTLWHNPWEHESDAAHILSLVNAMAELVPEGVRFSRKGTRVVRQATEAVRLLGSRQRTGVDSEPRVILSDDELTSQDRLQVLRESFRRLVDLVLSASKKGQPRRLVVFMDDLDKCVPESVLAFLEACKLFFAEDARIVFVFALDWEVLANAIRLKYSRGGGFDPNRYVEKIFEFSYTVHPIQWYQLGTLVTDLYTRSQVGDGLDPQRRADELAVIERVLQRPGVVLNPRKIKRIFNRFIWFLAARAWLPKGETVELELWLSWILVAEYWREFRAAVARFGDEVLGELCNRVTGNLLFPHANELVRQSLETMRGYRSLVEYFRDYVGGLGDMHTPEAQASLRTLVGQFVEIDWTLRTHGL